MPPIKILTVALLAGATIPSYPAAQSNAPDTWTRQKCEIYQAALNDALTRQGLHGLSPDFRAANNAFIASGCTSTDRACPGTAEETSLANTLVIATMNAGMASTFAPFGCNG